MADGVATKRWTIAEYERMGELGLLGEDDRVELIEGEIVELGPIGPVHANTVDRIVRLLLLGADAVARVSGQNPVLLESLGSVPQPDVALVHRQPPGEAPRHPGPEDVLLVIEVADSSLRYDRHTKLPLYPGPRLDLPPRPRLRGQGRPCAGPVRPQLERQAAARQRLRHQRRREHLNPGPLPLPSNLAASGGSPHARGTRVRPRRGAGLPGRLGRPQRPHHRPLRGHHRHHAFGRLADQVMAVEPYASARRVFWVVDNGSSHRGAAAATRFRDTHRNARLVHLPVHASWLNQVEIYFSIVQRKVLTPNDFTDLGDVATRLAAFERR